MEDEYTGYLNINKYYKENGITFELEKGTVMLSAFFSDGSKIIFDMNDIGTFGDYDKTRTIMYESIMYRLKLIKLKRIRERL